MHDARVKQDRAFDIVLFGATGYTGELVAEELLARCGAGAKWAIAGRDQGKLEAVRARLAAVDPRARELPIVVADSHDRASLDRMAREARVVCTTVGPYALHGSELVAACAAHGTDYCDLTGEVPWMRRMIDAHDDAAKRTGARIVHACGFDSIPSDLGVLLLETESLARYGRPCEDVTLTVTSLRGGASGGTLASMLNLVAAARRDSEVRSVLRDPYALNPAGERHGRDGGDSLTVARDGERGGYLGPFVMGPVNTRVVRRSNALLGYRYGRELRYREAMQYGTGARGLVMANGARVAILGLVAGAAFAPTRRLLGRLLPKPGQGPTREARESGHFRVRIAGSLVDAGGTARTIACRVEGHRDPGYGSTAILLAESALCLACDAPVDVHTSGVLTPATALGITLVRRLRDAGMVLAVE